MKKILTTLLIGLLCLSMFSMFAPQAKAESAYLTDLVQLTTNPYRDRQPIWSPDSSKIAYFAYDNDWDRGIWIMNADGSNKTRLTSGYIDETGDFSPDGTKMVFIRMTRGTNMLDLWLMDSNGANAHALTMSGNSHQRPSWSPDGERIAWESSDPSNNVFEIHTINVDGTGETTLVSGSYPGIEPYWSPDGTQIVYTMNDGIWLVNTSPPYEKTHMFTTSQPTRHVAFSPDGRYILYGQGPTGDWPNMDLYLIDSYGNFVAQLTNDSTIDYPFDWSPDGQYIAFGSIKSGNTDIWRAKIIIERAPDLVGYWKFDEGSGSIAVDSSGNGNAGSLVNSPQWVDRKSGYAVTCDGIDDYVEMTENTDLDPHTSDWTVSTWVNIARLGADTSVPGFTIIGKRQTEYDSSLTLIAHGHTSPTSPAKFAFVWDGHSQIAGAESSLMNVFGWHQVTGVRRGGELYVYVDGLEYGPNNVKGLGDYLSPTTDVSSGTPIRICYHGAWNEYYEGLVDEVKIYNYARTAEEIQGDFFNGWELDFTAPTNHPIVDFAVYNGSLYAAADNNLYVKDGSSWNVIDAPTFVTSLEPYEGKLIVAGQGGLYCYDGASFNLIFTVPAYIKVLGVYDNRLYAGTTLDSPPKLFYCNGSVDNSSDWYVDTDFSAILSFSGAFSSIDSFAIYNSNTDDPIGFWKFDEGSGTTAYDSSENENDGAIDGAEWTAGISGSALSFDGFDDFVEVPYDPSLYVTTGMTIEAWVKVNGATGDYQVIAAKWYPGGNSAGSYVLEFQPDGITPWFVLNTGSRVNTASNITRP